MSAKKGWKDCQRPGCGVPMPARLKKCPSCGFWDTGTGPITINGDGTVLLTEVEGQNLKRILTGTNWDKCFGGRHDGGGTIGIGIALGSTALIGGKAGAGKSTMALQLSDIIAKQTNRETMYVAAEESAEQIKDRALRLALHSPHLIRLSPMGNNVDLGAVLQQRKPAAVVLDSLPGFVNTPDEAVNLCKILKQIAVDLNAPFLIIDHINKNDDFAGFEKLQHEVDTTMMLFPTGVGELREMTVEKNRFGLANVKITMLMTEGGLIDVDDEEEEEEEESDA